MKITIQQLRKLIKEAIDDLDQPFSDRKFEATVQAGSRNRRHRLTVALSGNEWNLTIDGVESTPVGTTEEEAEAAFERAKKWLGMRVAPRHVIEMLNDAA